MDERRVEARARERVGRWTAKGLLRGVDQAERRNQGDNRGVGPVMYGAQIRAIVPITVQIIAHELVASGVLANSIESAPPASNVVVALVYDHVDYPHVGDTREMPLDIADSVIVRSVPVALMIVAKS